MSTRRRRLRITVLAAALAVVLSAGGAAVWAADRFLVEHVEISDVSEYEAANSTPTDSSPTTDSADSRATADSPAITVSTVTTGTGDDTVTYYVADVVLGDATQLRGAFAKDEFGTTSPS